MSQTFNNIAQNYWLKPEAANPSSSSALRRSADTLPASEPDGPQLSERENEIMHWVGHGKTNLEIGMILGISQFTVKNHLQRIFRKIDVRNRAQAVTRILSLQQQSTQLQ
ncbi:MAG TPA: LuxR C-terminal-related transcriptional regulator [Rhodocyclaceae bacterium]|nr:LuxR C-terminal-related transcriptional regulator [Rhodocyclaceae bacterium]